MIVPAWECEWAHDDTIQTVGKEQQKVAYFALLRGRHSFHATAPIIDTTQLFNDVYRHQGELYVRPLKVQQRHSPTLHMLHVWRGEDFTPVADSITMAEILTRFTWSGLKANDPWRDFWNRTFLDVEAVVEAEHDNAQVAELVRDWLRRTLRMTVSRDERVIGLLVYVVPSVYGQLPLHDRHKTARLIGHPVAGAGRRQDQLADGAGPLGYDIAQYGHLGAIP